MFLCLLFWGYGQGCNLATQKTNNRLVFFDMLMMKCSGETSQVKTVVHLVNLILQDFKLSLEVEFYQIP